MLTMSEGLKENDKTLCLLNLFVNPIPMAVIHENQCFKLDKMKITALLVCVIINVQIMCNQVYTVQRV